MCLLNVPRMGHRAHHFKRRILWYIAEFLTVQAYNKQRAENVLVSYSPVIGKANLIGTRKSPLVEAGWTEADCRRWCEDNDLLSPIYATATRGGCLFCHNQSVGQLRLLWKNYPEYWALMLKWDKDSPFAFRADGHTVHDFDRRFQLEDEGILRPREPFTWYQVDNPQMRILEV